MLGTGRDFASTDICPFGNLRAWAGFFTNALWHALYILGIFVGMGKRAFALFVNLQARALRALDF